MGHRSHAVTRRPELLCRAIKANGERCQTYAGRDGLCDIHAGRQNPREMGGKGGRGREATATGVRAAMELTDDELRRMARSTLEDMLRSPNEQIRARVATALVSYRARDPAAAVEQEYPSMRFLRELEQAGLCRLSYEGGQTYYALLDVQKSLEQTFDRLCREGEIRHGPLYTRTRDGWRMHDDDEPEPGSEET
jgi:hypothetical protein